MSGRRAVFRSSQVLKMYEIAMLDLHMSGLSEGDELSEGGFSTLTEVGRRSLKLGANHPVGEALSIFYGSVLNRDVFSEVAWRLAAGYKRIKSHKPLASRFEAVENLQIGVRVESVLPGRPSARGNPQVSIKFRVLTGMFGGLTFVQMMPVPYVTRVLARVMGMPKSAWVKARELAGMLLIASTSFENGQPRILDVRPTQSLAIYNRRLLSLRKEPCPWGYSCACYQCPAGHNERSNSCARATHPRAHVSRTCPRCKKRGWFDPRHNSGICLSCEYKVKRLE